MSDARWAMPSSRIFAPSLTRAKMQRSTISDHRSDNPASVTLGVASRPGLDFGMAITNLCPRATRSASELKRAEFEAGRRVLERKIRRIRPKLVAFVGVTLYRRFFGGARRGNPGPGLKPDEIQGARVFVLPNPSGLNASFPSFVSKLRWFRRLARAHAADATPERWLKHPRGRSEQPIADVPVRALRRPE